jgi:hypothetical protein
MFYITKIETKENLLQEVDFMAIDEDAANSFAIIKMADKKIGLSWYYQGIEPSIQVSNNSKLLLVGAGESVVFLSLETGMIKFSMGVHDSFSFFLTYKKDYVLIASETTITVVNQNNMTLNRFTGIPDIIVDAKIKDGKIVIKGLTGEHTLCA